MCLAMDTRRSLDCGSNNTCEVNTSLARTELEEDQIWLAGRDRAFWVCSRPCMHINTGCVHRQEAAEDISVAYIS